MKVYPNLGQLDAFVSGELNTGVQCLKICVMTTEPNEFPKMLQEEFSELSGRDRAPILQIQICLQGGINQMDVLAYPIYVIKPCFIAQIQEKNLRIFLYCSAK